MNLTRVFLVGIGGFLGSIARYISVKAVETRWSHAFPLGTFAVNVLGCFLLGLVIGVTGRQDDGAQSWKAFLGAGFCGGFTTFSAFALENQGLFVDRLAGTAMLYIIASVSSGILAVLVGLWCTRFL